jgi:DNA-binding transcriptional LysR family regulator
MNIKALRAFRAVASEGSVSAAARLLNLSQPALSRLLALLEAELHLPLFDRRRHRLVLTEQGVAFEREAARLLAHFDEIPRIAADLRAGGGRRVQVVTMPRAALSIVTPAVAAFSRAHPEVEVALDLRSRRDLGLWISGRRYDWGFGNVPVAHPDAISTPLVRSAMQVLVPAGHPLAARESLRLADLAGECLIAQFPGLLLRQQTDEMFAEENLLPGRMLLTSASQIAQHLVAHGAGVTVIDRLSTLASPPLPVVCLPLLPKRWVSFGVIRPRSSSLSASAELLIGFLRRRIEAVLEPGAIELSPAGPAAALSPEAGRRRRRASPAAPDPAPPVR